LLVGVVVEVIMVVGVVQVVIELAQDYL